MHIVIIGNGISGVTAARFLRKKSNHRITIISKESKYFFSRTALMYVYMGHMRLEDIQPYEPFFWKKNRINLLQAQVTQIDFSARELQLEDGGLVSYDKLILAVGSVPNRFGWPGENLDRVHGLYSLQDLEAMEMASEGLDRAVIVGGGLIGIEMAEMFHSRHIPVTMLVRESSYWSGVLPAEESAMVNRHILTHGIDLRLNTELDRILDDGRGGAAAVVTKSGEKIDCGYVGLTAGVRPNIAWLRDSPLAIERGVLVNDQLETNQPDVYAIGDCAQLHHPRPGRRAVEAVWYTGRMMGETVAYNILGAAIAYDPGIWFNSAKFLDIEYQVYGEITAKQEAHQAAIYWEHPDGTKSIRLLFHKEGGHILGFNLMGVRYRHEVCEKWLADKTPVETVLQHLGMANFDPEFYQEYETELIQQYNHQTGKQLRLRQKRGLEPVLRFLGIGKYA